MSLRRFLVLFPAGFVGLLILTFQNCARNIESKEIQTEVSAIEMAHVDRQHGLEIAEKAVVETRSEDLLSDRVLLIAQLSSVFGPGVPSLDEDGIQRDMTVFGSPCSLYENYLYETKDATGKVVHATADISRPCAMNNSAAALKATVYPQASVVRQGVLQHLCLKLATTPATVKFALKQIDAQKTPEPTSANVLKAFRLFYRSAPEPPEALIGSLQVLMPGISEDRPSEDMDWSPVLHTICVSSGWQLL